MKIKNLITFLFLLLLSLSSCSNSGSGNLITQTRNLSSSFNNIDVSNGIRVNYTNATVNLNTVKIEADDNVIESVNAVVRNNTLFLNLDSESFDNFTVNVSTSSTGLASVDASGGPRFFLTLASSGSSGSLDLTGSGGASINISSGSVGTVNLSLSGGSSYSGFPFTVVNYDVDLSGGSDAQVNASGTISGTVSGGSDLTYQGSPTITATDSGGSRIRRGN